MKVFRHTSCHSFSGLTENSPRWSSSSCRSEHPKAGMLWGHIWKKKLYYAGWPLSWYICSCTCQNDSVVPGSELLCGSKKSMRLGIRKSWQVICVKGFTVYQVLSQKQGSDRILACHFRYGSAESGRAWEGLCSACCMRHTRKLETEEKYPPGRQYAAGRRGMGLGKNGRSSLGGKSLNLSLGQVYSQYLKEGNIVDYCLMWT